MAVIIDADVIIRSEKGKFDFYEWVASHPGERFELAAITVAELRHGLERATVPHRGRRQEFIAAVLNRMPVIPYTEQTACEHARIWAELESAGRMIGYYDIIIAATAMERGSAVATFNKRHFSQVKGLMVIEPK